MCTVTITRHRPLFSLSPNNGRVRKGCGAHDPVAFKLMQTSLKPAQMDLKPVKRCGSNAELYSSLNIASLIESDQKQNVWTQNAQTCENVCLFSHEVSNTKWVRCVLMLECHFDWQNLEPARSHSSVPEIWTTVWRAGGGESSVLFCKVPKLAHTSDWAEFCITRKIRWTQFIFAPCATAEPSLGEILEWSTLSRRVTPEKHPCSSVCSTNVAESKIVELKRFASNQEHVEAKTNDSFRNYVPAESSLHRSLFAWTIRAVRARKIWGWNVNLRPERSLRARSGHTRQKGNGLLGLHDSEK